MAFYNKWDVKNDFTYVPQFFSLISDGLGGVGWLFNQWIIFFGKPGIEMRKKTLQIAVGFTRKPEMDGLDVGAGKIFSRSMALLNRTKDF